MGTPFPSSSPPPPPLSTNVMDRLNLAVQLEKYRDMLFKRWWIFVACMSVALGIGGYRVYRQPEVYVSHGSMMVRPRINMQVGDVYGEEMNNFYGTQVQLMKGTQVQRSAREKLHDLEQRLSTPPLLQFDAHQERNTSMFSLWATSTSAEYAQKYLDQVMQEYIHYKKRLREETSENTAGTILKEVDRLDKERKKAEQELFTFQKENNMAYFEGQGNVAAQYQVELKRRLAEIQTELDLLETETGERAWTSPSTSTNASPALSGMKNFQPVNDGASIRQAITMLKLEREDLARFLKPKHPKIMRLDEELERKQRLLKIAIEQTKEQTDGYRESLLKQKEALQKSIVQWEKEALDASQKAGQFALLKSNLARTKELYDVLLKQLQAIDVGSSIEQETISINEPATPAAAVGPTRTRVMLLAGLAGLGISFLLILLFERFDDRVRNIEDLQEMVTESVLGQIPLLVQEKEGPLLMSDLPPHNIFSESFRNVRSSLMFSPYREQSQVIGVTSAIPGDGKTTCSVNLSICLAQIEKGRTLLIDADMRKMNVHRYFRMENGPGLSEVLSGQIAPGDALVATPIPNLDLLRAGQVPPNPGELILSEAFRTLLQELCKVYHRIVIDTPPVLATDDALSLAPNIHGVIFVVKANQTSMRFVNRALHLLKQRGAQVFGLVLNHIDTTSAHYYYYNYCSGYYHDVSAEKSG